MPWKILACFICFEEVISMKDFTLNNSGKAYMNPKSLPLDWGYRKRIKKERH